MNYGMDYQGGGGGGGYGGGGGGFGGGGGGFSSQGSSQQASGGRARRSYDDQLCLPVTARMVLAARASEEAEGSLQLEDGRKITHVRIVGAVRSVEDYSTNVVYSIEDGTGLIDVKQWLDDNQCSAMAELRQQTLKEHVYLKIVGQVKEYDGGKQILADSIRPLLTGNELAHHMLEVVYSGEKHKRNTSYVAAAQPMAHGVGGGVGFGPNPGAAAGAGVPLAFGNTATAAAAGGGGGADVLREAVVTYIRTVGGSREEGANVQDCIRRLTGEGHSEGAVRKIIEDLAAEGHIYSTINEDNYKFAQ